MTRSQKHAPSLPPTDLVALLRMAFDGCLTPCAGLMHMLDRWERTL